jgi:twitching motility protein PilI
MTPGPFSEIKLNLKSGLTIPQNTDSDIPINEKNESIFGVKIANMGIILSPSIYCEVLNKIHVNALPNPNPLLGGILNLRGNLVPVFDLHPMFQAGVSKNKKRRIISIDRGEKAVALWIDCLPEIMDKSFLEPLNRLPDVPKLLQGFLIRGYLKDNQVWLEIKIEELLKKIGSYHFKMEEVIL